MPLFGPPNIDKMKAKGDVKGLIKALGYQKDSTVSQSASSALIQMGSRVVPPLIEALKDKEKAIQDAACDTLIKMGDITVDPLIKAVKSPQADEKAIKVLKGIGNQAVSKALEELIEWFLQGGETCKDAARALAAFGPSAVNNLLPLLTDTRLDQTCIVKGAFAIIRAANMEKVPHHMALLKKISDQSEQGANLRALLAGVLGEIGDPRAVDPLLDLLKSEDTMTRWLAAGALFTIGEDRTAETLAAELVDEDLFLTGTGSVWVLIGDGLTLKKLLRVFSTGNANEKQSAAKTLTKLGWKH